jgi:hypothetical protein
MDIYIVSCEGGYYVGLDGRNKPHISSEPLAAQTFWTTDDADSVVAALAKLGISASVKMVRSAGYANSY